MPQPLIELGGEQTAPVLHLAPANGFVPQLYLPLLRPLLPDYRAVSLPPRALWGDEQPPQVEPESDWAPLAVDLRKGFAAFGLSDVIAVGHSFGAIVTMLAAIADAAPFRAMICLDPTIFTPQLAEALYTARQQNNTEQLPLVQKTRRRHHQFDSVEDAYARFRSRRLFADWPDDVVRLYAEHGTVATEDGTRELTWSPEWEAYYFATGYTQIWQILPQLNAVDVPLLFINGGDSDTFLPESVARVRKLLPDATFETIPGHGHLFPQAVPQQTAALMQSWLAQSIE